LREQEQIEFYEKIKKTVDGTENFRPTSTYVEKAFKEEEVEEDF
jgi:hypothetical protein